jgi:hypothetical protein
MIYFCHIPKTSGTSVIRSVRSAFNNDLRIPNWNEIYDPSLIENPNQKDFELFLEKSINNYDFLYGHLGCGPAR